MTYAEIEGDEYGGVRRLIGDYVAPYRFSSREIYGYANDGIRTLFRARPQAFFVDGRLATTSAELTPLSLDDVELAVGDIDVVSPAGDRYQEALVYFAAGKCLARDDADTMNKALSDAYLNRFAELARM